MPVPFKTAFSNGGDITPEQCKARMRATTEEELALLTKSEEFQKWKKAKQIRKRLDRFRIVAGVSVLLLLVLGGMTVVGGQTIALDESEVSTFQQLPALNLHNESGRFAKMNRLGGTQLEVLRNEDDPQMPLYVMRYRRAWGPRDGMSLSKSRASTTNP